MLDQRTWRQTDISSQTVFTNYLTQWWLLGHGSCTWCTVRRQGGPFCCSSLRPRTHLNVCCSGSRTHTDTPTLLTYTSQNSNFKGRAVPVPVKSLLCSALFSCLFSRFSLSNVSRFGVMCFKPCACFICRTAFPRFVMFGLHRLANRKNVRRTPAKRGVNNWTPPAESLGYQQEYPVSSIQLPVSRIRHRAAESWLNLSIRQLRVMVCSLHTTPSSCNSNHLHLLFRSWFGLG